MATNWYYDNNWEYYNNNNSWHSIYEQIWNLDERKWEPSEHIVDAFEEIKNYAKNTYPDVFTGDGTLKNSSKCYLNIYPMFENEKTSPMTTMPLGVEAYNIIKSGEETAEEWLSNMDVVWRYPISYWRMDKKEVRRIKHQIDAQALGYRLHKVVMKFGEESALSGCWPSHTQKFRVRAKNDGDFELRLANAEDYQQTEWFQPFIQFFSNMGKKARKYVETPSGYAIPFKSVSEGQEIINTLENFLVMFL